MAAELYGGAMDEKDFHRYAFSTEELSLLLRFCPSLPADSPLLPLASRISARPDDNNALLGLKSKGVLDGDGRTTDEWKMILEGIAKPHWELSLLCHRWKDRILRHHYFTSPQGQHSFSRYFREEENLHVFMIHRDLMALREALLRAFSSEVMPLPGKVDLHLTFREFVALMGIIDLQRTSYLVSFIERSPLYSSDFSLSELCYAMGKGVSTPDPRWCVTLASIFTPREISFSREHVSTALLDLEKRSLLSSTVRKGEEQVFRPAASLNELFMALREVSAMTALRAVARDALSRKAFALVVIQGREGVVSFDMRGEEDDTPVTIFTYAEKEVSECLKSLFRNIGIKAGISEEEKSFLEPEKTDSSDRKQPVAPREEEGKAPQSDQKIPCPECGAENQGGAFSCHECASRLPAVERLITCPGCQKQISFESRFCRYCRFSLAEDESEASGDLKHSSPERGKGEPMVESQRENPGRPAAGERHMVENSPGSDRKDAHLFRSMRFCPECSREVHRESQFCRFCGHNLGNKEELDG
jgi:hypothetical protein